MTILHDTNAQANKERKCLAKGVKLQNFMLFQTSVC